MLTELARELLAGPNFATVATRSSNGSPQQSIVWIDYSDGEPMFSTVEGRAKFRNLSRDPRIGIVVVDRNNPYRYVALRGTARFEYDKADQLIDDLSHKYKQRAWVEHAKAPRVRVVITVTHTTDYVE
jgi:PPOX class probable F420-dependent enzyme